MHINSYYGNEYSFEWGVLEYFMQNPQDLDLITIKPEYFGKERAKACKELLEKKAAKEEISWAEFIIRYRIPPNDKEFSIGNIIEARESVKGLKAAYFANQAYYLKGEKDFMVKMKDLAEEILEGEVRNTLPDKHSPMKKYSDFWEEAITGRSRLEVGDAFIDRKCPFLRGGLWILGARTSVGKSAFAMDLALKASKHGSKVLFLSLEMDEVSIMQRVYANVSRRHIDNFQKPYDFAKNDIAMDMGRQALAEAEGIFERDYIDNFTIYYESGITVDRIDTIIEASEIKYDLVVVDYLQIMDERSGRADWEKIGIISKKLKQLALRQNLCVMALTQLNRGAEGDESPQLSSIGRSGSIENDADVVAFLTRQRGEKETTIHIKKNRQGGTEITNIKNFVLSECRFEDRPRKMDVTPRDVEKAFN